MAEDVLPVDLFPLTAAELCRRPRRLFKHARVVSGTSKIRRAVKQPFTFYGAPFLAHRDLASIDLLSRQWMTLNPIRYFHTEDRMRQIL